MKRIWLVAGVALAALALAAAFFLYRTPNSNSIQIGIVLPLSGSMAVYGENGRDGLELAKSQLEAKAGQRKIKLIYQDSGGTPQGTVTAVRRLLDVDNVRFIIGGLTSSGVLAAAPYAQRNGVLFFTPAASAPGIPQIGNLIFRNWPPDDAMSRLYGKAMFDRGIRSVAILYVSNDYGQTNSSGFAASFTKAGGTVVLKRSFPQGTTDFRALVAQISTLDPSVALLVIAYPDGYEAFFQQLSASTYRPSTILTSDTFYSPNLIERLGAEANGVITGVAAKPPPSYGPRQQFIESYEKKYSAPDGKPKQPGLVSDTAYDALNLVVSAIDRTNGSPESAAAYLLQHTKEYPGAAGLTTLTSDGDIAGKLALFRVAAGQFAPVQN